AGLGLRLDPRLRFRSLHDSVFVGIGRVLRVGVGDVQCVPPPGSAPWGTPSVRCVGVRHAVHLGVRLGARLKVYPWARLGARPGCAWTCAPGSAPGHTIGCASEHASRYTLGMPRGTPRWYVTGHALDCARGPAWVRPAVNASARAAVIGWVPAAVNTSVRPAVNASARAAVIVLARAAVIGWVPAAVNTSVHTAGYATNYASTPLAPASALAAAAASARE